MARCTRMAVTEESTPPDRAQMHPLVPHLPADGFGGGFDEGVHGPQGRKLADAEEKIAEDHLAPGGVVHLRVKLHPVEPPGPVSHRPGGASVAAADDFESRRHFFHLVAVAHPHRLFPVEVEEQVLGIEDAEWFAAVFPGRGGGHSAAQEMVHELDAVADAQNRHPQVEEFRVDGGGVRLVDAPGAAGKNDALGREFLDFRQRHHKGVDFAIDLELPHPPGDELGVLGAEIQDQDFLFVGIDHISFEFRVS